MPLMSEEHATTKWCPFAKSFFEGAAVNRTEEGEIDRGCTCLGSGCMAWNWVDDSAKRGYCGLASGRGA